MKQIVFGLAIEIAIVCGCGNVCVNVNAAVAVCASGNVILCANKSIKFPIDKSPQPCYNSLIIKHTRPRPLEKLIFVFES